MINDYYKILGVNETDSDEQITSKYQELRSKYMEERFMEGDIGNEAAKNLTLIENAYNEIMNTRNQNKEAISGEGLFARIETALKNGDLKTAQELLDSFDERNGEWHYYQSVIFYKKNWINEAKKQLEISIQINPNNSKYQDALNRINQKVNSSQNINQDWNRSGNYNNQQNYQPNDMQMGGGSCCQSCCDIIMCNILLNLCCNCN